LVGFSFRRKYEFPNRKCINGIKINWPQYTVFVRYAITFLRSYIPFTASLRCGINELDTTQLNAAASSSSIIITAVSVHAGEYDSSTTILHCVSKARWRTLRTRLKTTL
jgi:hypothetical protein